MKKLLLCFFLFSLSLTAFAQYRLTKNTVIKDTNGKVYSHRELIQLMKTKEYLLRPIDPNDMENTSFLLVKKEKLLQNVKVEKGIKDTVVKKELQAKQDEKYFEKSPILAESRVFKVGDKFKFEKFKDMNGVKYDFKKDTGKVVVLNFWFTTCPPCKVEIPTLNRLVEKYANNKDVVFLALGLEEEYVLKKFLRFNPFRYNIVADSRFYANKYGVTQYPTNIIIGKDGVIKYSSVGFIETATYWMEKAINEQFSN